jgi:predicted 3-demethylubiquinone-9 3-methyltransferase (glyoxalase superfamily)
MNKITPFLWFNDKAEEAMNFYTSIFKNSKKGEIRRYAEGGPGKAGTVMSATFEIDGQTLIAFNGGPHFSFTPAISLFVRCQSQEEVDDIWSKLVQGGKESRCGWLQDQFGLSWQIIPDALGEMLQDKDPAKAKRVMQAMMQMVKIDLAKLKQAYDGK